MEKKIQTYIVSGITPSGKLTIGNYLGAINNYLMWIKKKTTFLYLLIADLHAITTVNLTKAQLQTNIKELICWFYACGLKQKNTCIFVQSANRTHCQLGHILLCHTTTGELSRMTQFKNKQQKFIKNNKTTFIPTGILTYPTLMAADILLYDADLIPVGSDQKQHIELTRNIAQRINRKYQKRLFVVPDIFLRHRQKIMNLQNPGKKMSKSDQDRNSYILLKDNLTTITQKIKKAITDSENKVYYNVENKPGISNLLVIYCELKGISIKTAEQAMVNKNYEEFKIAVIDAIWSVIEPIQKKYRYYMTYFSDAVAPHLRKDNHLATQIAEQKLKTIQETLGFINTF